MDTSSEIVVYAPATMANISVGFDLLGAVVKPIDGTLFGDRVKIGLGQQAFALELAGQSMHELPTDPQDNIVHACWQGFARELEKRGYPVLPVQLTLEKNMPIGSGLGSSACSVVAALCALNEFHSKSLTKIKPLTKKELLSLMGEMEGKISGSVHLDNVAPCYLGGMQFILSDLGSEQGVEQEAQCQTIPHFSDWFWVMAYPGTQVATCAARDILPSLYPKQAMIAHSRHLASFIHACYSNQPQLAAYMLQDVLAEPYRAELLPDFYPIKQRAKSLGALALGISGSGPTLFCVCPSLPIANEVTQFLNENYLKNEQGFVHICQIDKQGAMVTGARL